MTSYLVRRFLIAIPILLGVSLVTFAFANFAPGDPLSALARPGSHVRPQDIEAHPKAEESPKTSAKRVARRVARRAGARAGEAECIGGSGVSERYEQRVQTTHGNERQETADNKQQTAVE